MLNLNVVNPPAGTVCLMELRTRCKRGAGIGGKDVWESLGTRQIAKGSLESVMAVLQSKIEYRESQGFEFRRETANCVLQVGARDKNRNCVCYSVMVCR